MKRPIYLVQSCPKDEFRRAAKKGMKCDVMGLHGAVLPVWATSSKKEAIDDCRHHNSMANMETIYYMDKISLFK